MKHLKLFESFKDIKSICKKYRIRNYTINPDGSVDVDGDVSLYNYRSYDRFSVRFTKLPLKFGKISGVFDCSYNDLTTLEGSPREVGGYFKCGHNKLTTLEGSPREVGGTFDCGDNKLTTIEGAPEMVGRHFSCPHNQLTTLKGAPEIVGGYFDCMNNRLTTLEGSPREVGVNFFCSNNKLTTLKGAPEIVGGYFECENNPVYVIYKLFKNHKDFMDSLDWDYIRGNNIVKSRFEDACEETEIEVPKSIKGYKYI